MFCRVKVSETVHPSYDSYRVCLCPWKWSSATVNLYSYNEYVDIVSDKESK